MKKSIRSICKKTLVALDGRLVFESGKTYTHAKSSELAIWGENGIVMFMGLDRYSVHFTSAAYKEISEALDFARTCHECESIKTQIYNAEEYLTEEEFDELLARAKDGEEELPSDGDIRAEAEADLQATFYSLIR